MDEDKRRQIEAEEVYRARIRQELEAESRRQSRPSYWTGFILNLLIIGIGHFVIGEPGWAVVWLLLAIVLVPLTAFVAWPFLAIGVLIHYRNVYVSKYVSA